MTRLLIGIVAVALVATIGDYVWYEFGVRHQMMVGVLHGAILLMAAGGALGWPANRIGTGLAVGVGSGVLGALAYYALVSSMGQTAMLAAWAAVWLLLAAGEGVLMHRPVKPIGGILIKGLAAAALSGIAFYAISDIIWRHSAPGTRNYGKQFACWLIAWAPGLMAIGASRPPRR